MAEILESYGRESPHELAKIHVSKIASAFPEGLVEDFDRLQNSLVGQLPDPDDVHVLAAAVKCGASVIVTDNIKDFPLDVLGELNLEAITSDESE